jgi:hypothetical protein
MNDKRREGDSIAPARTLLFFSAIDNASVRSNANAIPYIGRMQTVMPSLNMSEFMGIVTNAHAFRNQHDKLNPDEDKTYNER